MGVEGVIVALAREKFLMRSTFQRSGRWIYADEVRILLRRMNLTGRKTIRKWNHHLLIDRILSMCYLSSMQTITYTDARNQLAGLMEAASRDREPITITRNGAGKVVLLAIEEYEAMETTLHLHSTRANANQIQQSLADYEAGKIQPGELCD